MMVLVLNATSSWAVAKHYCTISGVSKIDLANNQLSCAAMPINMTDHRCELNFEEPDCCDIELIKHIGENTVLKRISGDEDNSYVAADLMQKVKAFETLPPLPHYAEPNTEPSFHQSSRLAYLQVFRL